MAENEHFWRATGQSNLQTANRKKSFQTHTTALWLMEQSSILSAKFDCPVARQNFSLLTTAHDSIGPSHDGVISLHLPASFGPKYCSRQFPNVKSRFGESFVCDKNVCYNNNNKEETGKPAVCCIRMSPSLKNAP